MFLESVPLITLLEVLIVLAIIAALIAAVNFARKKTYIVMTPQRITIRRNETVTLSGQIYAKKRWSFTTKKVSGTITATAPRLHLAITSPMSGSVTPQTVASFSYQAMIEGNGHIYFNGTSTVNGATDTLKIPYKIEGIAAGQ